MRNIFQSFIKNNWEIYSMLNKRVRGVCKTNNLHWKNPIWVWMATWAGKWRKQTMNKVSAEKALKINIVRYLAISCYTKWLVTKIFLQKFWYPIKKPYIARHSFLSCCTICANKVKYFQVYIDQQNHTIFVNGLPEWRPLWKDKGRSYILICGDQEYHSGFPAVGIVSIQILGRWFIPISRHQSNLNHTHTHTIDMDLFIPSSLHLMITNSYCRDLIICKYWTQKCQKKRGIWKFAGCASQDFIHILIPHIKLGFYNRCNIAVKTQFVLPNFYQSIFPDWSWYYILYPLLILLHVLVSLTNSIHKVTEVLYHGWKCRYKKAEIWKMMTSRIWAMIDSRLLGFTRLPGGRWGTSLW